MQNYNPSENRETHKKNKRETIRELAHRHLNDQNHTTTDEELRNAVVELSGSAPEYDDSLFRADNTTVIPPLPFENNNKDNNEKGADKTKIPLPNPYDILGS